MLEFQFPACPPSRPAAAAAAAAAEVLPTRPRSPTQPTPDKTSPPARAPQGRRRGRGAGTAAAAQEPMDEAAMAQQQKATDEALLSLWLASNCPGATKCACGPATRRQ
ncbi:unnamed protein product [Vitrella brassicaformis CCMP3155]|uniref:Uncharacterized protein n=1 Tax=Vitrella brassicaformis (strain CCMP3155) TaxID=1169540 RepID=A0A0G4FN61_VITBC|nr:unnamed protein product [Vitrella brassicaformis CCMP3155]|eukprot:CEM15626.1 unnamed protein product [Vitrella brassicaformis CCMP3155]